MGQVSNGLPNLFIFEIRGLGSARWTGISELHTGGPASNRKSLWLAISSNSPVNRQDDRVHSNELRDCRFSESDFCVFIQEMNIALLTYIWNLGLSGHEVFVLLGNFVKMASNERHTLDNIEEKIVLVYLFEFVHIFPNCQWKMQSHDCNICQKHYTLTNNFKWITSCVCYWKKWVYSLEFVYIF